MKFIVDTQLPPLLSTYLKYLGFDSIHTSDFIDGHLLNDNEIIEIAKKESRIIITKDKDFFDQFFIIGSPPKILLLKTGNINNDNLIGLIKRTLSNIIYNFENSSNLIILSEKELISF